VVNAAARTQMLRTMAISESVWYREVQQLVNYLEEVEAEHERTKFALESSRRAHKDCQAMLAKVEEERWRLAMPQAATAAPEE
jgi:hypothetical protein